MWGGQFCPQPPFRRLLWWARAGCKPGSAAPHSAGCVTIIARGLFGRRAQHNSSREPRLGWIHPLDGCPHPIALHVYSAVDREYGRSYCAEQPDPGRIQSAARVSHGWRAHVRALLSRLRSEYDATRIATWSGRMFALSLGLYGLVYLPMLAFVAFFIYLGAATEGAASRAGRSRRAFPYGLPC